MSTDDFVTLVTEKRDSADIGYESGTVSRSNWKSISGQKANPDQFSDLIEKGISHYGRILEIKVPDIISFDKYGKPFQYDPYRPVLEKAARIMQPKTGSPKKETIIKPEPQQAGILFINTYHPPETQLRGFMS